MIREIKNDVTAAIQEAFTCALHTNPGSFVLFLARGDYNHLFDGDRFANLDPKPSPYCLDFMPDIYRDETRNKFYVRYLNRRYKNDNFKYDGDEGIDDLCVEMMIYSHTWESVVFIKEAAPAVLSESLFMDNQADCDFLLTAEGQQSLVDLHVDGITNYLAE